MNRPGMVRWRSFMLLTGAAASVGLMACGVTTWDPTLHPPGDVARSGGEEDPWLKVHMQSGELYVLHSWQDPDAAGNLHGTGFLYGLDRNEGAPVTADIPRDSIALLETNDRDTVGKFGITGLSVWTGLNAAVTVACLMDPKSCFGSCPTFYATEASERPLAEGFSSSFARALEERDVDRLGLTAGEGAFSMVMRNEAQETHAVRHVRLLAVPSLPGESTFQTTRGELRVGSADIRSPRKCSSESGDCLDQVVRRDDAEYTPLTDGRDLAAREEVLLNFGQVSGDVGLVLSARNSLVTTYVFYQSLAYAGAEAGEFMAALERGEAGVRERVLGIAEALGGIEVFVREPDGSWREAGVFVEAGPIAADEQVVELGPVNATSLEVRLRMAKGSWRIDQAGLVELGPVREPEVLWPDSVVPLDGTVPDIDGRLLDPDSYLITTQGDAHRIWFTIPAGAERQLFLDSRGYYYEWMRGAWLAEQDPLMAAMVLSRPREALRQMAPAFKELEPRMERLFWSSRFRRAGS